MAHEDGDDSALQSLCDALESYHDRAAVTTQEKAIEQQTLVTLAGDVYRWAHAQLCALHLGAEPAQRVAFAAAHGSDVRRLRALLAHHNATLGACIVTPETRTPLHHIIRAALAPLLLVMEHDVFGGGSDECGALEMHTLQPFRESYCLDPVVPQTEEDIATYVRLLGAQPRDLRGTYRGYCSLVYETLAMWHHFRQGDRGALELHMRALDYGLALFMCTAAPAVVANDGAAWSATKTHPALRTLKPEAAWRLGTQLDEAARALLLLRVCAPCVVPRLRPPRWLVFDDDDDDGEDARRMAHNASAWLATKAGHYEDESFIKVAARATYAALSLRPGERLLYEREHGECRSQEVSVVRRMRPDVEWTAFCDMDAVPLQERLGTPHDQQPYAGFTAFCVILDAHTQSSYTGLPRTFYLLHSADVAKSRAPLAAAKHKGSPCVVESGGRMLVYEDDNFFAVPALHGVQPYVVALVAWWRCLLQKHKSRIHGAIDMTRVMQPIVDNARLDARQDSAAGAAECAALAQDCGALPVLEIL